MTATLRQLIEGASLAEAIERPRVHVEYLEDGSPRLVAEPGVDVSDVTIPVRSFDSKNMYFGGVGAAAIHDDGRMEVAADSRRTGGTRLV